MVWKPVHFCHRARSCLLKAVCTHPRSIHRRRGVHRLHTVDCRGTLLIPLSAHSCHQRTLLPMHTWTAAMRRTLSSVRRRPIDREQVQLDLLASASWLFAFIWRSFPPTDMFFGRVSSCFVRLALLHGLWCGVSVMDHSGLDDLVSFSGQSLSRARSSPSKDARCENVCVTLPSKSNSDVQDQGLPCHCRSIAEACCLCARNHSPILRLHCWIACCLWRMLNHKRSTTTLCTTEGRPPTQTRYGMPLDVTSLEQFICWYKASACCFFDPSSSRHSKSPEAPTSFRTKQYFITVLREACSPTKRQEGRHSTIK